MSRWDIRDGLSLWELGGVGAGFVFGGTMMFKT